MSSELFAEDDKFYSKSNLNLIDTHSMEGFASAVKHHLISRYGMEWPNESCYVCQLQPRSWCVNQLLPVNHTIYIGETWNKTRQIRTPVLRIPPAVTSQAKMKNWLHECQKWVSHMIGHYAHIYWGRTLIFNPMQDHDPSDISTKMFLNPLKRMRVIIRTSTDGVG